MTRTKRSARSREPGRDPRSTGRPVRGRLPGPPSTPLTALLLLLGAWSCTEGAGCGNGCGSEGGGVLQPIPGGYPIASRIENAAQVRVTQSGLDFLESNVTPIANLVLPGGLDFAFTKQVMYSIGFVDFTICDDDDCSAHIELESLVLTPKAPNRLTVSLRAKLDSRDASGPPGVKKTWDGTCDFKVDTTAGSRDSVGFVADIVFSRETEDAREGYTYATLGELTEDPAAPIESADIQVSGGFVNSCALLNFGIIKDFILNLVVGPLSDQITETVNGFLCTTPGEFGCPDGTFSVLDDNDEPVCRYANSPSARCVPRLLGMEGQGDFGASLLGGFSPGTSGPAQFVVASGGNAEAVSGGLSLFLYGGLRSTDSTFTTSPAHHDCVPVVAAPPLPTVARSAVFRGNTVPGSGDSAHVGIGLSEDFLNHAAYGIYDSGMLCLGVGTRLSQRISSGLFSLLISSIERLTFPNDDAPVAITLRPSKPPSVEVGTGEAGDPLVTLGFEQLSADFYIFSQERYVRFMTFTGDLAISLDVEVSGSELQFAVGDLVATNSSVTNSELLAEDPAELAGLIESVLTGFAGQLANSIPGFELPSIMGFSLEVPDDGVLGIEDAGEEFLAVFANLSVEGSNVTGVADTEAQVARVDVDADSLTLKGLRSGTPPTITLDVRGAAREGAALEYSHRINEGAWSPWSEQTRRTVSDRQLLLQGEHEVFVRARVKGEPETQDPTPVRLVVPIDVTGPRVRTERTDTGVRVTAWDAVTPRARLEYRTKVDGGAPSAWKPLPAEGALEPVAFDDAGLSVEVRDDAGNVTRTTAALIRGIPDPGRPESCDCRVPGSRRSGLGVLEALLAVGLLGIAVRRRTGRRRAPRDGARGGTRRTRTLLPWLCLALAFGLTACSCSDDKGPAPCEGMCPAVVTPNTSTGAICCAGTNMCVAYDLESFCDPGFICKDSALVLDDDCQQTCSECVTKPALGLGEIGTHLDAVPTGNGGWFVAGYAAGEPPSRPYGDLVAGPLDPATGAVGWVIVDGAPESPITNDPAGWRGGVSAPGDDVGRYASVIEAGDGSYLIAYHDATAGALKVASGSGETWALHVVDDAGIAGGHADMLVDGAGLPTIAYMRIERDDNQVIVGSMVVARATTPAPTGSADWSFATVASRTLPCRPAWCGDGQACLATGTCATPTNDCAEDCEGATACLNGACAATLPDDYVEDWAPAVGYYAALAPTAEGLALVFYDRTNGTLYGAAFNAGTATWSAPFAIDGYGSDQDPAGDSGIGASLVVDGAGVWHVAYADGTHESLRYARIEGLVIERNTVDPGADDGMAAYPDGKHLVGDDTAIGVTAGGEVRIAYQDATAHTTMLATRPSGGGPWSRRVLDGENHTGFWLRHHVNGETSTVLGWWRGDGSEGTNGVRALTVP